MEIKNVCQCSHRAVLWSMIPIRNARNRLRISPLFTNSARGTSYRRYETPLLPGEPGEENLSSLWTTSTFYKLQEIERRPFGTAPLGALLPAATPRAQRDVSAPPGQASPDGVG